MAKKILKIAKRHPNGVFQLGRHKITFKAESFDLNKKEEAELESEGCKYWIAEIKKEKKDK